MYDAVVIGLGGVGSFALRALAKNGGKGGRFLGIERYTAPRAGTAAHGRGSSHGKTRIYRRAYFEHANYVPWIEHSLSVFRELEKQHNVSLMQECGTLLMAPSLDDSLPPLLENSRQSATEHGIPVEFFNTTELQKKFPQFNYNNKKNNNMVGLLEPGGGMLRSERIMEAALKDAESSGCCEIMEQAHMIEIKPFKNEVLGSVAVRVKKDNGEEHEIVTKCILISMGAWTGQLVHTWAPYLEVTRQIQGWINVSHAENGPDLYKVGKMPTWVMETPGWPVPLYGLPCDSDDPETATWLKVASHRRNELIKDPSKNYPHVSGEEEVELQRLATKALDPGAWPKTQLLPHYVEALPCLYTMTPDTNFLIGVPKDYQNVFCVAGLSGHGFKMTPALGQMMADYALGKDLAPWNLDFCSPTRFGV